MRKGNELIWYTRKDGNMALLTAEGVDNPRGLFSAELRVYKVRREDGK